MTKCLLSVFGFVLFFSFSLIHVADGALGLHVFGASLEMTAAIADDHDSNENHDEDRDRDHESNDNDSDRDSDRGDSDRDRGHDDHANSSHDNEASGGDASCVCPPGVRSCVCADGTPGSTSDGGGLIAPNGLRTIHGGS